MPGRRRRGQPDVLSENALVASAARLDLTKKPKGVIQQEWQEEAWGFYDECGELRYAAQWMGNSLSRVVIYAADVGEDGKPSGQPTSNQTALGAAYDLLGGPANQSQILSQVGVHLTIAGDCYVIGETPVDDEGNPMADDEWYVASTSELTYTTKWEIDRGNGKRTLDPDRTVIIRIWQSHPRKKWQADSPTRAVLPVLRELKRAVQVAGQVMDSKLAGAGILLVPNEVQFPAPSAELMEANPNSDPGLLALAEGIMTPLADPEDSSRLVPTMIKVPGAFIKDVRHISFASQAMAENRGIREDCIRRLALGLDMPPEQLLGMGQANHWGAWAIEEAGVKLHISPKMTTIVQAFQQGYYEPALKKLGLSVFAFTLWFDVSELTQRPNRGEDAKALHEVGELSGAALRREVGFDEKDAPTRDERIGRLLVGLINARPELLEALLPELNVDWVALRQAALPAGPETAAPAGGTDAGTTDRALPAQPSAPPQMQEALLTAAHQVRDAAPDMVSTEIIALHLLTERALELAGKRLLTRELRGSYAGEARRTHEQVPVTAERLPALLRGAFDWAPEMATMIGLDPDRFTAELTSYVSALLTAGQQHQVAYLGAVLRKVRGQR